MWASWSLCTGAVAEEHANDEALPNYYPSQFGEAD
jgi:hypothetical protein